MFVEVIRNKETITARLPSMHTLLLVNVIYS